MIRREWAFVISLGAIAVVSAPPSAHGFESRGLVREADGESRANAPTPCAIPFARNGTCANYRWYNFCSSFIWLYAFENREGVGVLFGGPLNPCVASGNRVKRVITYFRSVRYSYNYENTVDVYLERDDDGDGCPDGVLAARERMDPGERWNCVELNVTLPPSVTHVIVRTVHREGDFPLFVTDGNASGNCDPVGIPKSFYYGINGATCIPWDGPTARYDNFPSWVIMDQGTTDADATSWGKIKSLFQ